MTISAAFRVLAAACTASLGSLAVQRRDAVLGFVHERGTAPLSASIGSIIKEALPGEGLLWSTVKNEAVGKIPEFEANLTQALDLRVSQVFDWAMREGGVLAAWLGKQAG